MVCVDRRAAVRRGGRQSHRRRSSRSGTEQRPTPLPEECGDRCGQCGFVVRRCAPSTISPGSSGPAPPATGTHSLVTPELVLRRRSPALTPDDSSVLVGARVRLPRARRALVQRDRAACLPWSRRPLLPPHVPRRAGRPGPHTTPTRPPRSRSHLAMAADAVRHRVRRRDHGASGGLSLIYNYPADRLRRDLAWLVAATRVSARSDAPSPRHPWGHRPVASHEWPDQPGS